METTWPAALVGWLIHTACATKVDCLADVILVTAVAWGLSLCHMDKLPGKLLWGSASLLAYLTPLLLAYLLYSAGPLAQLSLTYQHSLAQSFTYLPLDPRYPWSLVSWCHLRLWTRHSVQNGWRGQGNCRHLYNVGWTYYHQLLLAGWMKYKGVSTAQQWHYSAST